MVTVLRMSVSHLKLLNGNIFASLTLTRPGN